MKRIIQGYLQKIILKMSEHLVLEDNKIILKMFPHFYQQPFESGMNCYTGQHIAKKANEHF